MKHYWVICDGTEICEDSPDFKVEDGDFKVVKLIEYEKLVYQLRHALQIAYEDTCDRYYLNVLESLGIEHDFTTDMGDE